MFLTEAHARAGGYASRVITLKTFNAPPVNVLRGNEDDEPGRYETGPKSRGRKTMDPKKKPDIIREEMDFNNMRNFAFNLTSCNEKSSVYIAIII